jgi:16S rRNA C967 or C1407 C5-methylase (RsmB/RsmF family)
MKRVFQTYIPHLKGLQGMVNFQQQNAKTFAGYETFDRILLDVPCTNDRVSANIDDNNMFKGTRLKERVKLPEEQSEMLVNAIKCLKPGGSIVYSTCSLSPIQNDGVVHMSLKKIHEDTDIDLVVCDLKEAFRPLRGLFRIHRHFKYGQQIVPFLPSNFGPLYVCKLRRQ